MKKTFLSYFLIFIAMFLFAGCGGSKNPPQQESTTPASQQAQNTTQQPTPVDEELEAIFKVKPEDYDPMFSEEEQKMLVIPQIQSLSIINIIQSFDYNEMSVAIKCASEIEMDQLLSTLIIPEKKVIPNPSNTIIIKNGLFIIYGYIIKGDIRFDFYENQNEILANGLPLIKYISEINNNDCNYNSIITDIIMNKIQSFPDYQGIRHKEYEEYKSILRNISQRASVIEPFTEERWQLFIRNEIAMNWPVFQEKTLRSKLGYGEWCENRTFLTVTYGIKVKNNNLLIWGFSTNEHSEFKEGLEKCENKIAASSGHNNYNDIKNEIELMLKKKETAPCYIYKYNTFLCEPDLNNTILKVEIVMSNNGLNNQEKVLRIILLLKAHFGSWHASVGRTIRMLLHF